MVNQFMWLYKILLVGFLVAVVPFTVCSDVMKLSSDLKETLADPLRFHEINAVASLPSEVVALIVGQGNKLADRGKKWESSDAIVIDKYGGHLPTERLIWAVTDGEYYVIHYERNAALAFRPPAFLIAHFKKGEVKILWRGAGYSKSFQAFLEALNAGTIDDRENY